MEDIDADTGIKEADYMTLAECLFTGIAWSEMNGLVVLDDMGFELRPSAECLSITARGPGDTVASMDRLVALVAQQSIVIVDGHGSEILVPIG